MNRILMLVPALILSASSALAAQTLPYEGQLDLNGTPVTGTYNIGFEFSAESGSAGNTWSYCAQNVDVTAGAFSVDVGAVEDPPTWLVLDDEVFLSLSVSVCTGGVCPANCTTGETALAGEQRIRPAGWSPMGVPAGTIAAFAGSVAPEGWLLCNGGSHFVSRYPRLAATLAGELAIAEGDAEFTVPDLRGQFVRGLDDGEAGVDQNGPRSVGSVQSWSTARPQGPAFRTSSDGRHTHRFDRSSTASGSGSPTAMRANDSELTAGTTSEAGLHNHTITSGGDAETRPTNVAFHYIIKY